MTILLQDFLNRLENGLKKHLKETYLPEKRFKHKEWTHHDLQFFCRGADMLSTAFTEERDMLPKNYFNKKEFRSAYILYFTLINAAKVWHCLHQLGDVSRYYAAQEGGRALHILDLGAGPATAAIACSDFFRDRPIEIFALEQNRNIANDGLNLWKKMTANPKHHLHLKITSLSRRNLGEVLKNQRFDLAIAANFLSEIDFLERLEISRILLEKSKAIVFIEPALRKTTRDVMALRDQIVSKGLGQILSPCPHQCNCPMAAAGPRDWCHFYFEWKCPSLIRQVDQLIGNKHDYLKMAYMIINSSFQTTSTPKLHSTHLWRIVSSPLISAGKKEFILCGWQGKLQKVTRLNKDRSETNQDFDRIKRGDKVEWSGNDRIERTSAIKKVQAF